MRVLGGMFLALVVLVLPALSQAAEQTIEVRVRLRKEQPSVSISGFALRISAPTRYLSIENPPSGLAKAKVTRKRKGLWVVNWGDGSQPQRIESDQLWIKGQMLRLGVEPVPYSLELHESASNSVDVIARLDMESYLMGVLPSEMPLAWPLDALKAQAVAARSFVMRSAYERRDRHFDVDSTIIDQVYKFLAEMETHPEYKVKLMRAVKETRGEVLVDSRDRIIKAFYSADCGCQTEDPKYVWGKVETYESVKDPTCKKRKPANWKITLDRQEVRGKLLAAFGLGEESSLRGLHIGGRTPSGRVAEVIASVSTANSRLEKRNLNSQEFRRIFGFQRIRSTDFLCAGWAIL